MGDHVAATTDVAAPDDRSTGHSHEGRRGRRQVALLVALAVIAAVGVAVWLGVRAQVRFTEQGGALSGAFVPTDDVEVDERLLYGVPAGVTSMVAVDPPLDPVPLMMSTTEPPEGCR